MHKPKKQAALGFIFATLLIDVIGLGIIIPVIPKLIGHLIHGDVSDAAGYAGWLTAAYASMQFFCAPLIGNLSDRFGRRPVLLCSLLGFSVDYLFSAFAPTIWLLFVGRIVAGITGASFTTATAYIADISEPEKRAANFGLVGVAFGLGFIIGPVLGGILGKYDVHYPFIAAAGLAMLNAIYGYFILPESLAVENRRPLDVKKINPFTSLFQLKKYKSVIGLAASLFLVTTCPLTNRETCKVAYRLNEPELYLRSAVDDRIVLFLHQAKSFLSISGCAFYNRFGIDAFKLYISREEF